MIKLILLLMIVFCFFKIMSKFGNKKWFKYYILAGLFVINPLMFLIGLVVWMIVRKEIGISPETHKSADEYHGRIIDVTPEK